MHCLCLPALFSFTCRTHTTPPPHTVHHANAGLLPHTLPFTCITPAATTAWDYRTHLPTLGYRTGPLPHYHSLPVPCLEGPHLPTTWTHLPFMPLLLGSACHSMHTCLPPTTTGGLSLFTLPLLRGTHLHRPHSHHAHFSSLPLCRDYDSDLTCKNTSSFTDHHLDYHKTPHLGE